MSHQERAEHAKQRYLLACHAMQSGVAAMEGRSNETTPKHLRVGVNSAMVDSGALVGLLLEKHIIAEHEYFEALAERMEAEVHSYEKLIQGNSDTKITLL